MNKSDFLDVCAGGWRGCRNLKSTRSSRTTRGISTTASPRAAARRRSPASCAPEAGFRRWEQSRTPANFVAAVFGFVALVAVDFVFLLPFLATLAFFVLIAGIVAMALCLAGLAVLMSAGFFGLHSLMRVCRLRPVGLRCRRRRPTDHSGGLRRAAARQVRASALHAVAPCQFIKGAAQGRTTVMIRKLGWLAAGGFGVGIVAFSLLAALGAHELSGWIWDGSCPPADDLVVVRRGPSSLISPRLQDISRLLQLVFDAGNLSAVQ
jgi:hypothetical protein